MHWNQFTSEEKKVLINMACDTPEEAELYHNFLQTLVTEKTGVPAKKIPIDDNPPWLNSEHIPLEIQEKAAEFNKEITIEQWKKLTSLQRFALIKLSRPSHENSNFYPALEEFNL